MSMTPPPSQRSSPGFLQRSIHSLRSGLRAATGLIVDEGKVKALPIVVMMGVVTIVAVAALIVSILSIQASRERAARDSCMLITGLVYRATPRDRLASATAFLRENGLSNCNTYAHKVIK